MLLKNLRLEYDKPPFQGFLAPLLKSAPHLYKGFGFVGLVIWLPWRNDPCIPGIQTIGLSFSKKNNTATCACMIMFWPCENVYAHLHVVVVSKLEDPPNPSRWMNVGNHPSLHRCQNARFDHTSPPNLHILSKPSVRDWWSKPWLDIRVSSITMGEWLIQSPYTQLTRFLRSLSDYPIFVDTPQRCHHWHKKMVPCVSMSFRSPLGYSVFQVVVHAINQAIRGPCMSEKTTQFNFNEPFTSSPSLCKHISNQSQIAASWKPAERRRRKLPSPERLTVGKCKLWFCFWI